MKKLSLLIAVFCIINAVSAQRKGTNVWYLNWEPGTTVGSDFVNKFSWRGGSFGYGRFISDNTSVGVEINWNSYYEYKPTQTYTQGTTAVTTDFYKYIYTLPLSLKVSHYFNSNSKMLLPYAALGVGTAYGQQKLFYNIYESGRENWGFSVIPEVGLNARFNNSPQSPFLNFGVRYKYSTNSWKEVGVNNVSSVNFFLGLSFMID